MYIEWRNNAVSRDIVTRWTSQETKPITKTISQTQHYAGCHTGYHADYYAGYHADNHADYYAGCHEGHHAYYHTGYHEDYHEGDHVDYHAGYYTGYNLDWQQNEMIMVHTSVLSSKSKLKPQRKELGPRCLLTFNQDPYHIRCRR